MSKVKAVTNTQPTTAQPTTVTYGPGFTIREIAHRGGYLTWIETERGGQIDIAITFVKGGGEQ